MVRFLVNYIIMSKGPLSLFDYFFYRITSFYEKVFGDEDRLYGVLILSLLQGQNILAITGLVFLSLNKANDFTSLSMVIVGTFIPLVMNAIRYNVVVSFKDLNEQWSKEDRSTKRRGTFYFFLYVVLSIVAAVVLISLSRSQ